MDILDAAWNLITQGVYYGWPEMPLWDSMRAKYWSRLQMQSSYLQFYHQAPAPGIMVAPLNWGTCPSWSFSSQVFDHRNEESNRHTSIQCFHLLNLGAVCFVWSWKFSMPWQHSIKGPCEWETAYVRSWSSILWVPGHFVSLSSALSSRLLCLFCAYFIAQHLWSTFQGLGQALHSTEDFMLGTIIESPGASMDRVLGHLPEWGKASHR